MLPNLLINGTTGIAVGMSTNITHNPGEVIDGVCAYIDNPDISVEGLMKYILALISLQVELLLTKKTY